MLLLSKRLLKPQMISVYRRQVKTIKRNPVFTTSHAYARSFAESSSVSQSSSKLRIRLLYNLVHALAAQVVRICNLTKGHSLAAHLKNFRISVRIARGPWFQRSPLPAWKSSENFLFFCREHGPLLALTDVTNPRSDGNFLTVNNFDMNGRDSGMTSTFGELSKGCCVQIESGFVVHG